MYYVTQGVLIEFDVLAGQFGSTTNGHVKLIRYGLLMYCTSINTLTKQKIAMRRAIRKPLDILLKIFFAQLERVVDR